jgi:hypothetical protein
MQQKGGRTPALAISGALSEQQNLQAISLYDSCICCLTKNKNVFGTDSTGKRTISRTMQNESAVNWRLPVGKLSIR